MYVLIQQLHNKKQAIIFHFKMSEVMWSVVMWGELIWYVWNDFCFEVKWSEVKW